LAPSFRGDAKRRTSDAQLRVEESRDSGFDASHRAGMTTTKSPRLAECQIDPLPAQQGMLAIRQRRDAVKLKPRWAAPHHDVAMLKPKPARPVAALQSAEQEDRGQAQ
jgi:hypothetical protein